MRPVPDEYVTREELAQIARCSTKTIQRLEKQGLPRVTWGRRMVRYPLARSLRWMEDQ